MQRGSITVFLSMVLTVVISVVAMTVESARWACVRLYLKNAAEYSLKSVFADYYVPLFNDYGLTLLDCTYGGEENMVPDKFEKYLSYNMNPNKGSISRFSFLYGAKVQNIDFEDVMYATYGGGEVVRRLAYDYMKYKLPADYVEGFLEQFDFVLQAKAIETFFEKIDKIQKDLEAVDEIVITISNFVESVKSCQAEMVSLAEQLGKAELAKEEAKKEAKEAVKELEKLLEESKESFEATLMGLLDSADMYDSLTAKVKEYLDNLSSEWLSKLEVPESIKHIIKNEIEALLIYSGGEGDIYGIEEIRNVAAEMLAALEAGADVPELSGLDMFMDLGEDAMAEGLGVELEALLKELKSKGIYALICPDYEKLSTRTADYFYNRSYAELAGSLIELPANSAIEEVAEQICFCEYIDTMFSNYCDQDKERPLLYETEYIIGGNFNEKDNIKDTIDALIGVREVLNLLYLLGDAEKKKEAHGMAMACVGASGVYAAVKITEYLILAVWALGEALIDVRILMSGDSVPIMKDSGDWRLDLKNITGIFKLAGQINGNGEDAVMGAANIGDFKYGDYLKIVLFMSNKKDQAFRVMDLIETDIQNKYYSKFYFNNCIYSMKVKGNFYLEPLFENKPLFTKKSELSYQFSY